jgi:hypothetical protein
MLSKTRAYSLLTEFTDVILEDDERGSIIVSIQEEHLKTICYELRKFNLRLVHKTKTSDAGSYTLVFMLYE